MVLYGGSLLLLAVIHEHTPRGIISTFQCVSSMVVARVASGTSRKWHIPLCDSVMHTAGAILPGIGGLYLSRDLVYSGAIEHSLGWKDSRMASMETTVADPLYDANRL